MINAYGKRKAAGLSKQVMIASAITVSCVAFMILYHTLSRTYGALSGLLKKIQTKIIPCGEEDDHADMEDWPTVYEEDAGDSYEI